MIKKSINMAQFLLFIGLLVACKDRSYLLVPEPVNPLEGKVKSIVNKNEKGNSIKTEWIYDQTTKQITGARKVDSLAKITIVEAYKRDADGKILSISLEKTPTGGTATKSERVYQYNNKNQVSNITETKGNEQIVEDLVYDIEGKLTRYTISTKKNNQASVLQLIQYTWKQGNVSGIKDRNLQVGYEEEDYQYNSSENALAKLYREEFKLSAFTTEFISQNQPVSSVKLFEGSRYKYEYEYNKDNQLIGYKILINKNNNWENYNTIQIGYYTK